MKTERQSKTKTETEVKDTLIPGGFLTIIVAVTSYYSNNCYISCDKFDSH